MSPGWPKEPRARVYILKQALDNLLFREEPHLAAPFFYCATTRQNFGPVGKTSVTVCGSLESVTD